MRSYVTACLLAYGIFVAAAVSIPLSANAADAVVPKPVTDGVWVTAVDKPLESEPPSIMDRMNPEPEPVVEVTEEPVPDEPYYGPYDESLNNNPAYINGGYPSYDDGFADQGVREFNGRTETYYSSNVAYHYRTPEWSVDDEGYYRDDQGRYVVAASDVPEGSEIQTSKGIGIVLDSGPDGGVTDFYVAF